LRCASPAWTATSQGYAVINPGKDKMNTRRDDKRRHGRPSRYPAEQRSTRPRVTVQEIQKWISRQHGFVPRAMDCPLQRVFGIGAAGTSSTENPCPPEKIAAIKSAFQQFGVL
jgi:hypothetical protein